MNILAACVVGKFHRIHIEKILLLINQMSVSLSVRRCIISKTNQ